MSGIVGSLNTRGSGLINIGSATDGQVFTGTGAGLPVGFEAVAGGGKILQVVSAIKTDTASSTSTTFADVSGLSVTTGTLASTSSRVLVIVSMVGSTWDNYSNWCVVDGAGAVITGFVGDANGSAHRCSGGDLFGVKYSPNTNQLTMNSIDSPASTSAQTYKVQVQIQSGTTYINRGWTDATTADRGRSMSSIIAIEIGA